MREIPEEVLFDRRLIERHIEKGYITREQAQEHLANAPDATDLGQSADLGGTSAERKTIDPAYKGRAQETA